MEFGQECTEVPTQLDLQFEKRLLQAEIILLAEESCHATVFILERANG